MEKALTKSRRDFLTKHEQEVMADGVALVRTAGVEAAALHFAVYGLYLERHPEVFDLPIAKPRRA